MGACRCVRSHIYTLTVHVLYSVSLVLLCACVRVCVCVWCVQFQHARHLLPSCARGPHTRLETHFKTFSTTIVSLYVQTIFSTLVVTFFLLAGGNYSASCKMAAGYVGFFCGSSAIYAAFAMLYQVGVVCACVVSVCVCVSSGSSVDLPSFMCLRAVPGQCVHVRVRVRAGRLPAALALTLPTHPLALWLLVHMARCPYP